MQNKGNGNIVVKKNTSYHLAPSGRGRHAVPGEGVYNKADFMGTPSSPLRGTSPARGEVNGGFTLIELLVVVLIIGILAAVAVPQYQRAVEKSKTAQALPLLKSVYQAAKAYKLTHGTWPTTFEVLDVDIPWTGTENWQTPVSQSSKGKSNDDWSVQLHYSENRGQGVTVGRISGPYQGIAFTIYDVPCPSSGSQEIPAEEIVCVEGSSVNAVIKPFTGGKGTYCEKFFKGTLIKTAHANRYYKLP